MIFFNQTDYQGNIRAVTDAKGAAIEHNDYYPYGMLFGTSVGKDSKQPFKFGGKEYISAKGFNTYDFGARGMDGSNPRWTSIDPFAEKYYSISPYAYVGNNPIMYIDPDGRKRYKVGVSYGMNSGFIGGSIRVAGIGLKSVLAPWGGAKQDINVYVMYDTDKKEFGIGISHTKTHTTFSADNTLGTINISESEEKNEVLDVNTTDGYSVTRETSSKKEESVSYAGLKKSEDGTLSTAIDVSVNLLMLGIEAKVEIKIEPDAKPKIEPESQDKENKNK